MRRYELMLLFRPDLEDDKLQSAVEKVTRAIVNAGGALTKVSPWGKRRLAYDIQHFREASYFLLHFDIAPSEIRELERGMLISEEILRHLVTVLEDRGEAPDEEIPAAVPAARRDDDGATDEKPDEAGSQPAEATATDAAEADVASADAATEDAATADAGDGDAEATDAADGDAEATTAADDADESRASEPVEA